MKNILSIFLLFTLFVSYSFGFYENTNVVTLTTKNFASQVFGSEHIWMVEFYAPWCGHCKSLKPEYEKAAKNLKGLVRVGAVNCDEQANKELCSNYQIQGFPTIKYFPSKLVPAKAKGTFHKVPEDYQKGRTAKDIIDFALSKLPSFVTKVTDEKSVEKFITSTTTAKALLFTDKPKTSNLYKALSVDFHNDIALAEGKSLAESILEKFQVTSFPTLLVFPSDDQSQFTKYEGKLEHESLFKFLSKYQTKGNDKQQQQEPAEQQKAPAEPTLDYALEIKDKDTFDKHCGKGVCLVTLFDLQSEDDKESNQQKIQLLNDLAKKNAGRIKIVWADGSIQSNFVKQLDLAGLPSVFVLNGNKSKYIKYLGSFTEKNVQEFISNLNKKTAVDLPKGLPEFINSATTTESKKSNKKDEL
ncbi:hypothetical protein CYY_007219 [Polysphondylium violaceum]|uniref:protein disulfide-isomerase n=1 Tax=Polysphondylium violaceum TaxID=133409 RepID=A0A8J4PR42_9MYCE|nr:hypothetical protein CYY_007219 [Polysphondylium violaceum]